MYHMFLLSIIRVRPSPTIFASTQPNYLHIYRISCKITKKERRERSLPCYDSHGLIQHVKRIYNNNNNNNTGHLNSKGSITRHSPGGHVSHTGFGNGAVGHSLDEGV